MLLQSTFFDNDLFYFPSIDIISGSQFTCTQALSEGNHIRATQSSFLYSPYNQDPRDRLRIKNVRWVIGTAWVICAG